jgi:hypothetical protein
VTSLDHPSTSSPLGIVLLEVDLLATSTDMRREFTVFEEFSDGGEIVGLV